MPASYGSRGSLPSFSPSATLSSAISARRGLGGPPAGGDRRAVQWSFSISSTFPAIEFPIRRSRVCRYGCLGVACDGVSGGCGSLVDARGLITKIYFPRLIAPFGAVLPGLLDLAITLVALGIVWGDRADRGSCATGGPGSVHALASGCSSPFNAHRNARQRRQSPAVRGVAALVCVLLRALP